MVGNVAATSKDLFDLLADCKQAHGANFLWTAKGILDPLSSSYF